MAKHDATLVAIFDEPTRANIRWADIESLLRHLGARVVEGRGSRVRFILSGTQVVFHRPHPGKEAGKGVVESAREYLITLGVTP